MTTTDHAAEYTRADNAIRSLTRALDAQRDAIEALLGLAISGDARTDADAVELRADMDLSIHRIHAFIRRETVRRDAAELAQRAAAE